MRRQLDELVQEMISSGLRYDEALREFKRQYLREALLQNRGNQARAAELLGMHRSKLSRLMADLELSLAAVRAKLSEGRRSSLQTGTDVSILPDEPFRPFAPGKPKPTKTR